MITIKSDIVCKHDFTVSYDGTTVANGSVEFPNASEQEAAKVSICSQVASQYGCKEDDLCVFFWRYTGLYDRK